MTVKTEDLLSPVVSKGFFLSNTYKSHFGVDSQKLPLLSAWFIDTNFLFIKL